MIETAFGFLPPKFTPETMHDLPRSRKSPPVSYLYASPRPPNIYYVYNIIERPRQYCIVIIIATTDAYWNVIFSGTTQHWATTRNVGQYYVTPFQT